MSGRLNHRAVSSSRSARSTSTATVGNSGAGSANEQIEDKRTRSRTESGDRLKEEDRPTIKPVGLGWEVHPYKGSRKPPTVMGALVREMYPDGVKTTKGMRPALTWEDFKRTSTAGQRNDRRVLAEFWWRFKCLPCDRAEADRVLDQNFTKRVTQMLGEEKKNAVNKLYKDGKVPEEEVDADGNRWPTVEALISAKPKDFTTDEGWRLLCEHWSTPSFRKKSLLGKRNRLAGGDGAVYHRNGSRSLAATRQHLTLKNGVDPGLGGAWLHTHQMQQGRDDDVLCSESATQKWENYSHGMEQKHGKNWKVDHPQLDVAVVYERVGRTPHGRLAIADEAISITEKEEIKTRKRNALPHVSAREHRLERENDSLKRDNNRLRGLERVMRVMAAKGGMDYDALLQEAAPDMVTSESEVGFSREHDRVDRDRTKRGSSKSEIGLSREHDTVSQDGIEHDNLDHDGDEEYVNDDEDYGYDGDDYCDNGGDYGLEDDDYYDNGGGYYGHEGDDDYDHY